MSVNYIQKGNVIDYVNNGGAAIEAGSVVIIVPGADGVSGRIGIAAGNIPVGKVGAVSVSGVYEFPKATGAVTLGAPIYWDDTEKKATTVANVTTTYNTLIGWAVAAALSADAGVKVKLQ